MADTRTFLKQGFIVFGFQVIVVAVVWYMSGTLPLAIFIAGLSALFLTYFILFHIVYSAVFIFLGVGFLTLNCGVDAVVLSIICFLIATASMFKYFVEDNQTSS